MLARARVLADLAPLVRAAPRLGDGEFTRKDFAAWYGLSDATAERELDRLAAEGTLACADRIDPRTGRRCKGYWRAGRTGS